MACRIQLLAANGNAAVLRVAGWTQAQHVSSMEELIEGAKGVTALDLAEVTLVNRDVVPFFPLARWRRAASAHPSDNFWGCACSS